MTTVAEIKAAIQQLSLAEHEIARFVHDWKDDEWDEQMKHNLGNGKLDDILNQVHDIEAGRLEDGP